MSNIIDTNSSLILSFGELTGTASMQLNDMYDDYDLDDFAVEQGINIKRFEPIGFSFKAHREEGSGLKVYCIPRRGHKLVEGESIPVTEFH